MYLRDAGEFLLAIAKLLKLKVDKMLGVGEKTRRQRQRVKLSEVVEVLKQEEDLEWLYGYEVRVGRPKGSKDTKERPNHESEHIHLYKEFRIQEYIKELKSHSVEDFTKLKTFLHSFADRIERIRFFMAWLVYFSDMHS